MTAYDRQVFLNVPFDGKYKLLLEALVFAVHDCGLIARCARERQEGTDIRLHKLYTLIEQSRFGIHDLSRTEVAGRHQLPRFNMPLELGLFLGAKRFGSRSQRRKSCLILEQKPYQYQVFCSDIAGQDVHAHGNDVDKALAAVRNWLQTKLPARPRIPGTDELSERYLEFRRQLSYMCKKAKLRPTRLSFLDHRKLVAAWIAENPKA